MIETPGDAQPRLNLDDPQRDALDDELVVDPDLDRERKQDLGGRDLFLGVAAGGRRVGAHRRLLGAVGQMHDRAGRNLGGRVGGLALMSRPVFFDHFPNVLGMNISAPCEWSSR
jgi:hypothetical protein